MTVSSDKRTLRRELLLRRQAIPTAEQARLSEALCRRAAAWLDAQRVDTVCIFFPVRGEPDLRGLAPLLPGKVLALPVVQPDGLTMAFHVWEPGAPLLANKYGIAEPDPKTAPLLVPGANTAVLTPCLALDLSGVRLGYGGGFYDRFLTAHPALLAVGILYSAFCLESLPHEAHDVRLRWQATEAGVEELDFGIA